MGPCPCHAGAWPLCADVMPGHAAGAPAAPRAPSGARHNAGAPFRDPDAGIPDMAGLPWALWGQCGFDPDLFGRSSAAHHHRIIHITVQCSGPCTGLNRNRRTYQTQTSSALYCLYR